MQTLYDIDKGRNIVNGLISYYRNRMMKDYLFCHPTDTVIGKIHKDSSFEHCTCGHAAQVIIKNNIDLFTSIDSIEGITFGDFVGGTTLGAIGFIRKSYIYDKIEPIQPLSRDYNILDSMIETNNMFSVWDFMKIIYRPCIDKNQTNVFEEIVEKFNEDPIVRLDGTKADSLDLHAIYITLTKDTMQIEFSYKL